MSKNPRTRDSCSLYEKISEKLKQLSGSNENSIVYFFSVCPQNVRLLFRPLKIVKTFDAPLQIIIKIRELFFDIFLRSTQNSFRKNVIKKFQILRELLYVPLVERWALTVVKNTYSTNFYFNYPNSQKSMEDTETTFMQTFFAFFAPFLGVRFANNTASLCRRRQRMTVRRNCSNKCARRWSTSTKSEGLETWEIDVNDYLSSHLYLYESTVLHG